MRAPPLQHTEPGLDTLIDAAPCGFVSFADDGNVLDLNRTLLTRLGYERDAVVGHHIEQLLNIGTRIFYQTHWFPLLRLHGRADEVFLMLRTRAGDVVGMLSYAHKRAQTEPNIYDCVLVEVRERAKYEEELLRAKRSAELASARLEVQKAELQQANDLLEKQNVELELQQQQLQEQAELLQKRTREAEELRQAAEEANRAKSTFLATMSHELRTPLNAIGGYLQILDIGIHGPLSDAQREIVARIDKSSRHLLRLINEVLNLARIESGRVEYHFEDAYAADLVSGILPMIEPQFANRTIELAIDVNPAAKVRIDVDKAQQILLNLLGNAVKFTPAGGHVTVRSMSERSQVRIAVSDTGIGIGPERLEDIFQPFVQVDASHRRTVEGSGLGLAISRDLARGMGGNLTAHSEVGVGSTFTLLLPAADSPSQP